MKPDSKPPGNQPDASGVTQNPFALRSKKAESGAPGPQPTPAPAPGPKRPLPVMVVVGITVGVCALAAVVAISLGGRSKSETVSVGQRPNDTPTAAANPTAAAAPTQQTLQQEAQAVSAEPLEKPADATAALVSAPTASEPIQPAVPVPPPVPSAEQIAELERQIQSLLKTAREEPVTTERLALVARLGVQLASARSLARGGDPAGGARRLESIRLEAGRAALDAQRARLDGEAERLDLKLAKDLIPEEWASLEELFRSASDLVEAGEPLSGLELASGAVGRLSSLKAALLLRLRNAAREAVSSGDRRLGTEFYLQLHRLDVVDAEALTYLGANFYAAGELFRSPTGLEFSFVPPGSFVQGSPNSEPGRDADELMREVEITRGFHILRTEVTQRQWDLVNGEGSAARLLASRKAAPVGAEFPMHSITFAEAEEFCGKLSVLEKAVVRLPTEAEWEYAARAGSKAAYSTSGDTLKVGEAIVDDPSLVLEGPGRVATTGAPNAWGLSDVHGNVFEWTSDWSAPYAPGRQTDPRGPADADIGRVDLAMKVVRGGSWRDAPRAARFANRGEQSPVVGDNSVGFRVVREVRVFSR